MWMTNCLIWLYKCNVNVRSSNNLHFSYYTLKVRQIYCKLYVWRSKYADNATSEFRMRLRLRGDLTVSHSVLLSNSKFEHLDVSEVTQLHRGHGLLHYRPVAESGDPAGVGLRVVEELTRAGLKHYHYHWASRHIVCVVMCWSNLSTNQRLDLKARNQGT